MILTLSQFQVRAATFGWCGILTCGTLLLGTGIVMALWFFEVVVVS